VGTISGAAFLRRYEKEVKTKPQGADWVEVRFDSIPEKDHGECLELARSLEKKGIPVLGTIRSRKEGGNGSITERRRWTLYSQILEAVSWIDVERMSPMAKEVVSLAHRRRKKVVISYHHFTATPSFAFLTKIYRDSCHLKADFVKIATMVRKPKDHEILLKLVLNQKSTPLCVIGMGNLGMALRAYLPIVGSALAYGYLDDSAAPGQISCSDLRNILKLLGALGR
jgi:3-dehydroquinate dehydratase-1